LEHREKFIREVWVRTMEVRIVGEELAKCYRHEGVNHKQNCAELADRYLKMLRKSRV
ncbi:hypothetical protein BD324DRAFT_563277, partial [Kockovaella imperatae]